MRVFLTDLHLSSDTAAKLIASLPKEQAHRAGDLAAATGFLLVRYAIRQLCPDVNTAQWICDKNGKPRLAEGLPFFNLSHSRHGVAVAVSTETEVGIDIEEIRPHPKGFAKRYYSPKEQACIEAAADPTSELIRIWTAKEAAAKCLGTGIDANFKNIPTNGVQNTPVAFGGIPHWLAVSPTNAPILIEWVSAEQLFV